MNIVWIFVDSVRRYYSEDDRSRLKIMDKFGFEMIRSFQVKKQIGIFGTGCDEYVFKLKQRSRKKYKS